jgi:hypothetical protein
MALVFATTGITNAQVADNGISNAPQYRVCLHVDFNGELALGGGFIGIAYEVNGVNRTQTFVFDPFTPPTGPDGLVHTFYFDEMPDNGTIMGHAQKHWYWYQGFQVHKSAVDQEVITDFPNTRHIYLSLKEL